MTKDPAFFAYTLTVVVNSINILFLWNYSGGARGKSKTTRNPEDARTVQQGAAVVESDPEAVARVLRAHRNTFDNTIPFLLLGALFVAQRPDVLELQIFFGVFTAARLFYSVAYLGGLQPWRTLSYLIGVLATLGLIVEVLRHAFA